MCEQVTKILDYHDRIFKEIRPMTMVKNEKMFCPKCGKKEVWIWQEGEDFYVGKDHICLLCEHHFTIQTYEDGSYDELKFALEELRK